MSSQLPAAYHSIKTNVYAVRFELFFASLMLILFGSLVIPDFYFEKYLMPILLLLNIGGGVLLVAHKKTILQFFRVLFVAALVLYVVTHFMVLSFHLGLELSKLALYALFYATVTLELIKQVWNAKRVGKTVIMGLITGYLSLGLLCFFIFYAIEVITPHSFSGLLAIDSSTTMADSLMYYSYVTLLSIGYGDIIPATAIAQKAAVFTGLLGQFYIVIITAVVVAKYVDHTKEKEI